MAIDTAAKRRNVGRFSQVVVLGLAPSSGIDTADRVNTGRAYIGFSYQEEAPEPEPEPEATGGGMNSRRKTGIGR